ncbi:MAG: hypothetical protein GDA49_05340 [Rhodospirillales bacterium]|nr:hypothetical protein [Rhodospirillales bacterium]
MGQIPKRQQPLYGRKNDAFYPLRHNAENHDAERAEFNALIESTLKAWSQHADAIGARLICFTQTTAFT